MLVSNFSFGFHPVKVMDPVGLQKIDQEDRRTERPGDRIGPGNSGQFVDKSYRNGDIGHPEQTPTGKHGEHRHRGLTCTAHDTGDTVGECQQKVKRTDCLHMAGTEVNGL